MADDFRGCEFCGCITKGRARACCELGRARDLDRLEPELLARWAKDATGWLDTSGSVIATRAGRVLVLIDEVNRLRELRNAVGRLSRELTEVKKGMEGVMVEERKASERSNRLARMLGEALEVLEEPGRYTDGGLAKLRRILTSEEEPKENLHASALEAWRADAETHLRAPDLGTRRLARRLVAVIDELEEEERKAKGAAQAWLEGQLLGEAERARSPVLGVAIIEEVSSEEVGTDG